MPFFSASETSFFRGRAVSFRERNKRFSPPLNNPTTTRCRRKRWENFPPVASKTTEPMGNPHFNASEKLPICCNLAKEARSEFCDLAKESFMLPGFGKVKEFFVVFILEAWKGTKNGLA